MKELRFTADGGVWRIGFAFDPERKAVLLVAADKSGVAERRLYRRLIIAPTGSTSTTAAARMRRTVSST